MTFRFLGAIVGPLLILAACQKKQLPPVTVEEKAPVAVEKTPVEEVKEAESVVAEVEAADTILEKGKRLYLTNCLQCHNRDPNVKGSIGPEVVDAPLEVMTAKIMTGKYPEKLPEGFVPKRKSTAMRKIPKLKEDIPAIWAYVQSLKK
jgi:mono/diheme cytochrome c family protein